MRKTGASRVEEGEESELLPFTHTALPGPLQVRLDTKDTHTPPIRKLIPTSASSTPYCGHLKCCGCHLLKFQNHPITYTLHNRPLTGLTNSPLGLFLQCRCQR